MPLLPTFIVVVVVVVVGDGSTMKQHGVMHHLQF